MTEWGFRWNRDGASTTWLRLRDCRWKFIVKYGTQGSHDVLQSALAMFFHYLLSWKTEKPPSNTELLILFILFQNRTCPRKLPEDEYFSFFPVFYKRKQPRGWSLTCANWKFLLAQEDPVIVQLYFFWWSRPTYRLDIFSFFACMTLENLLLLWTANWQRMNEKYWWK